MKQARQHEHHNTAEHILEAIAPVFADKGYEGTRVDELARAAGVNKATLYYQIGDKEALYHAVLTRLLSRTAEDVCGAVAAARGSENKIRAYIQLFARNTGDMRYASPLLLREVACGGRNLPDSAIQQMGRMLSALDETLSAGEKCGDFRQVNSFMVQMMIVGSLNLYAANEPIRRRNVERNPAILNEQHFISTDEAGDSIADLVLAAIRNPATGN